MEDLDRLFEEMTSQREYRDPTAPPWPSNSLEWWGRDHWIYSLPRHKNKRGIFDIVYRNEKKQLHRIYGPAWVSEYYRYEIWFKDGLVHRDDGPAYTHKNNSIWAKNGKYHRLDGPAIVADGHPKLYYIDGVKFSPKQYWWEINRRQRKKLNEHS